MSESLNTITVIIMSDKNKNLKGSEKSEKTPASTEAGLSAAQNTKAKSQLMSDLEDKVSTDDSVTLVVKRFGDTITKMVYALRENTKVVYFLDLAGEHSAAKIKDSYVPVAKVMAEGIYELFDHCYKKLYRVNPDIQAILESEKAKENPLITAQTLVGTFASTVTTVATQELGKMNKNSKNKLAQDPEAVAVLKRLFKNVSKFVAQSAYTPAEIMEMDRATIITFATKINNGYVSKIMSAFRPSEAKATAEVSKVVPVTELVDEVSEVLKKFAKRICAVEWTEILNE
jgi:hypothetical protein